MHPVQYIWDHWKFNADQRLKAFNFFVVLSVFSNGGLFTAIEKCVSPIATLVIGGFIALLAVVFWIVDARSVTLLNLSTAGLKDYELASLPSNARLFYLDKENRSSVIRYTFAFRLLFVGQLTLGFFAFAASMAVIFSETARAALPILASCKG